MQIGNFQTSSSLLYLHYYNRRILVACCQQGKHRLLRRCYVPKPGIVHITRGTFPPPVPIRALRVCTMPSSAILTLLSAGWFSSAMAGWLSPLCALKAGTFPSCQICPPTREQDPGSKTIGSLLPEVQACALCGTVLPQAFGCGAVCLLSVPDRKCVLFGLAPPR